MCYTTIITIMNKRTLIGNFLCTLSLLAVTTKPAFAETSQPARMGEKFCGESNYAVGETENVPNSDFLDFIDMKVEIRNAERASQIEVEQWDEGEIVPLTYDAPEFKEGYILASLDPELCTNIILLSAIGGKIHRSNKIFFPALLDLGHVITFNYGDEMIAISGINEGRTGNSNVSYTIATPTSSTIVAEGKFDQGEDSVDISHLSPGDYILAVRKEGRILGRTKFTK